MPANDETRIARPLTANQARLLRRIGPDGFAADTIRDASELRWLEHMGLTSSDASGRHVLTPLGKLAQQTESR